jgi:hypothetical protein
MTAAQWVGLIPVVAYERALFAVGIGISYVAINALLGFVVDKFKLDVTNVLRINRKFVVKA